MPLNINKYLFKGTAFLDLLDKRERKHVLESVVRKNIKKARLYSKKGFILKEFIFYGREKSSFIKQKEAAKTM